ncbi:hypothetical protein C5167_033724 [Papaver somniferum]|uniref:Uncharacterized protein n=1 Tax=Papaver somniferum TaxID=3469 RepID=A0A4Y7KEV5_PAPSO|nr:hypothetical protein C5167_033724 [Papaver somniferum]
MFQTHTLSNTARFLWRLSLRCTQASISASAPTFQANRNPFHAPP